MTAPLADDELTAALIPLALDLVTAVHAMDATEVAGVLDHAATLAGDHITAARHLSVLLAAMVNEDMPAAIALGWTRDHHQYGRQRALGVPSVVASLRAARTVRAGPIGGAA